MIKRLSIVLICSFLFACKQKETTTENDCNVPATRIVKKDNVELKVYNFDDLEPLLANNHCEEIRVINFWATWCKPCVAELPYFEKLHTEKNIPVTLISLDIPNFIESKLIPFIQKEKLKSTVIVLDDPDANSWIPKVAKDWSGAIPATLIIKGDKRKFYEQSFTYETLTEALNTL